MSTETITNEDVTVVVQGPVYQDLTTQCLLSIRACMPDSKIILSTWRDSDVSVIKSLCDEVIFNEDVGAVVSYPKSKYKKWDSYSNVNRQIISTFEGLKRAQNKYALKLRTDTALTNSNFLEYFDRYVLYDDHYKCVQQRVLLWNLYTRNPHIKLDLPYHYSDVAMFGLTDDLLKIWDIPLCPEGDFVKRGSMVSSRYRPEQHLWLNFLRKYKDIDCPRYYTASKDIMKESENYMINNVVLLNTKQFGLQILNKDLTTHESWTCYSHADWDALYRKKYSGCYSVNYLRLRIKECYSLIGMMHFLWRKVVKAIVCLIPNKRLRRLFRRWLY